MSKVLKYDSLIIGSSFDAFLTALKLQQQGASVAMIEAEDTLGGLYRSVRMGEDWLESHINFLPQSEAVTQVLAQIQALCPDVPHAQPLSLGPITFQNGQTQPFLGFGESSLQALEQYASFLTSEQLQLPMGWGQVLVRLKNQFQGATHLQSEVTALEIEPETAVTLNGTQRIVARDIYFFENLHKLSKLLTATGGSIPKNFVQKISKIPLWTSINLVFLHSQTVTESPAVHVLFGAKEQPCLGRFRVDGPHSTSQWLSFVSQEVAADTELMGATIREMKKQIKRMYPNFFEKVAKEYILIAPESYGTLPTALTPDGYVPKTPTLKVGSRFYTETPGILGDFEALAQWSPIETAPEAPLSELST